MNMFDVVIIGGGPAGCATALTLYRNTLGASCFILDDADPTSFKIGESLPPESVRLLHYLHPSLPTQLSSRVASGTYTLCTGNASAWASPVLEEQHAIMNPFGHGHHLNRSDFDEILRMTVNTCASESKSRFVFKKGKFKRIFKNDEGIWNIEITDVNGERKNISTKWVVDATGRKASVATKLGAKVTSPNPLLASYAVFAAQASNDDLAGDNDMRVLIEATPDGWWYSSLISRNPYTRIVVFHTLPSHPSAKSSRRYEGFLERLHETSTHISGIIEKYEYTLQGGFPRCTTAGSSYLEKPSNANERWVAVGDAALAFDPLSSQGIMTALEMGIYVGLQLAQHIGEEEEEENRTEVEFDKYVQGLLMQVRSDYEKHREYYYSIVKRFQGEMFWENVTRA